MQETLRPTRQSSKHSFAQVTWKEVTLEGTKCQRVDSYVVGPPLFRAARTRKMNTHVRSRLNRQGDSKSDAFSQCLDYISHWQYRCSSTDDMVNSKYELHKDFKGELVT